MSEAKYREAYDKAKQEALKMAAQLSAHEKGVMVRDPRFCWRLAKREAHIPLPLPLQLQLPETMKRYVAVALHC